MNKLILLFLSLILISSVNAQVDIIVAFPHLSFTNPVDLQAPADGSNRIFVVEQAGGRASDGHRRILDIQPDSLHQRTPLIIGSKEDVEIAEEFIQDKRSL